ncbi:DUF5107 domain-containing protein [Streptomyces anulatus]|uniref:DUF5107 domain-containing protein n=1 Tax=Streptomyces anulatus TaxID=1892 RepID=UPI001C280B8C|nr:DUF5107 domain-containing protein [Streptomyces anulatus]
MATTVRRAVLNLPAAPLGPENPLPPLRTSAPPPVLDPRERAGLPRDMARQLGHRPLRTVLPTRLLDGYGRERTPTDIDAVVIENARLRVTVLPGLGGRIHSLHHKPTGRELLHRNPVLQPAAFALNGAWFSGGIEWNIGATGHTALSCAPLHAALVPAPDGSMMVRLWEWERLRDLPFQVDLWLPDDSDFLHVGVRIRNPHEQPAPVYWWSNTAVPQTPDTRVLVPADEAWHFGYDHTLTRVGVPESGGLDHTYPLRSEYPADHFYELPDGARRWIAALDGDGHGLAQTSTDLLRGRKLFRWGHGRGGRRWQEWLNGPGGGGYAEIQAGLARTQLEHIPLEAGAAFSWLESYGPLSADPAAVHGGDWAAATEEAAARLEEALPRSTVEEAYAAWLPHADTEPGEVLAVGSGWGALEVLRGGHRLPGTPFAAAAIGVQQTPWRELLEHGTLPKPAPDGIPGPTPVSPSWRDMLETADADPHTEYHLGIAQWHADDRAQAVRSWERGLECGPAPRWPLLRCLAVAAEESGRPDHAAELYAEAFADLGTPGDLAASEEGTALLVALARETVEAQLSAGRPGAARALLAGLPGEIGERGRFRLLLARTLVAEGDTGAAREIFDAGFEVADLREGAGILGELWASVSDEPLPDAYDFRMRPPEG